MAPRFRLALLAMLFACRSTPDASELAKLLDETRHANDQAKAYASTELDPGFTLSIAGQITKPGATIGWSELQRIGETHVKTVNPQDPTRTAPTDFRGWLVRDLLDRFGADPAAEEITFVAIDGFRATVRAADARAMRMLLAIEANGAPIQRSSGGPIFLVHPHSESEESRWRYPDRFWSFYVTDVVIGTEQPRLTVHGKTFGRAELDVLPHDTFVGPVGFKVEWPADTVHLRGVRLVDVIAAAGVTLPPDGRVIVRGKSAVFRDREKPVVVPVADLERCRSLIAMEVGTDNTPITAKLGGPLVLVPCGGGYERSWVTFVDEIEVVR